MKKRSVQVLAGVLTATAMAAAFVGTTATEGTTTTTVEYTVEKAESFLVSSGESGALSKFHSFDDVIKSLKPGDGYYKGYLRGYQGEVLMVGEKSAVSQDVYSRGVKFYTKSGDKIFFAGEIYGKEARRTDNGVIVMCSNRTYETYLISKDGKHLLPKDYIEVINGNDVRVEGFTNELTDENTRVKFTGNYHDVDVMINNAQNVPQIKFTRIK